MSYCQIYMFIIHYFNRCLGQVVRLLIKWILDINHKAIVLSKPPQKP